MTQASGTAPASQAAPSSGKIALSVAVWTDAVRTWQKKYAMEWGQNHPNVNLTIAEVTYNDMPKKSLAELATGTLQDVEYSSVKWMDYNIFKGACLPIDDLVKSKDPGMDDFIPVSVQSAKFEGKLYALPSEVNTGNQNIIMYNKDLLDAKGVAAPTDNWTQDEFVQMAVKLTDKANKVYGTDYFPAGTYYDFGALVRGAGSDDMSEDGKKFTFTTDPKSVKAAQWATDIRAKYHAAPLRAETQSMTFAAGKVALSAGGVQTIVGEKQLIKDKFKWDAVLGPTTPDGGRGFDSFVLYWNIYAKTKQPETAFDLISYLTSKDVALWSFINQGQPPARQSIWASPEAEKVSPVWGRAVKWLTDGKDKGPFPVPWNLRYTELEDKWENLAYGVFYGETPFDEGIKKVQEDCGAIVDLPRP